MSGEPLVEELSLDIQPALTALEPIGSALDELISSFSSGLADGIQTALGSLSGVDTSAITSSVEDALASATSTPVPVEGDVSALDAALADALDAPRDIAVDADTTAVVAAVEEATGPQTISVDGDVAPAQEAISSLDAQPVTLEVDADTSAAQDQIDNLGASATSAIGTGGAGGGGGGSGLAGLEGAVLGVKAATGGAQGEVGGLTDAFGGLSSGTALAVGGLTAFGAFIGKAVSQAADEQVQLNRFNQTFGALADQVRQIDVGGLNISLEQLGVTSGTTSEDLNAAAARIGQLGHSAGASDAQIVSTTQNLLALGATFSVNNPRLGDAAEVTDRLTNAFARGGRALAPFGLSLSAAQIQAEALKETGKGTAAELTLFEKAAAGANLALQGFGDQLGTKFQEGAQNAEVQLRALKTQLIESLDVIGGPLLEPVVQSMQALTPVAIELGQVLGALANAVLPLVASLAPALQPVAAILGLVADGITVLSDAVHALSGPELIAIGVGLGAIAISAGAAAPAIAAFGAAVDIALGPVGIIIGGLAILGAAFGLFGDHTNEAKVDATDFADALLASGTAMDTLAGKATVLTSTLNDAFQKLLQAGKAGQTAADGAAALGLGYDDLTKILLSTDNAFNTYQTNLISTAKGTTEQVDAQLKLESVLQQTRDTLVASASANLQAAVQSGALTQAQIDQFEASHQLASVGGDLITVYEHFKPAIEAAAEAQQKQALAQSQQNGELAKTVAAFRPATDAVATYSASLQQLGVDQKTADQLAKDTADAFQAQADKSILASSAVTNLNLAFVQGKISAGQLEGGVFALGTSLTAAQGNASGLTDAIASFAKSAVGALPDTGTAIESFSKRVSDAFKAVVDAAKKGPGEVAKAQADLRAALNPTQFINDLTAEAAAIAGFQTNLAKLVSEGLGSLAGELARKGPEIAGQLAQTFADHPAQAAAADGAVRLVQTATDNFNTFASGPEAAAAMGAGGTALANAANAGYAGAFNLRNVTIPEINAVAVEVAQDQHIPIATGLTASSAVAAWTGGFNLANPAQVAILQAAGIIGGDTSVPGAAQKTAADATTSFGGALDPSGQISAKFADGANALLGAQASLITPSQGIGTAIGLAFGGGLVIGIQQTYPQIAAAAANAGHVAENALRTALLTASPSKITAAIGADFTAGFALGIENNTAPVGAAVASIASTAAGALGSSTDIRTAIAGLNQFIVALNQTQQAATAAAALQQIVQTAVSQLPSAGTAIATFGSTLTNDLNAIDQALAASAKAHAAYQQAIAASQAANEKYAAATAAVTAAQQKLFNDAFSGQSKAIIDADKKAVEDATSAQNKAKSALDSANSAFASATRTMHTATDDLAKARAAAAAASDPATFINNLNAQTREGEKFLAALTKLSSEGFTDLAKQLAEKGPQVAGALAEALAASPAKAKAAEAAIDAAAAFSDKFQTSLGKSFSTGALDKISSQLASGLSSATGATIQQAKDLITQLESALKPATALQTVIGNTLTTPVDIKVKPIAAPVIPKPIVPTIDLPTLTFPTPTLPVPKIIPLGTEPVTAAGSLVTPSSASTSASTTGLRTLQLALDLHITDANGNERQVTAPINVELALTDALIQRANQRIDARMES